MPSRSLFLRRALSSALVLGVIAISRAHPQDRTTEAGEASITDPNAECKPYSYPPLTDAASQLPPSWQIAQIISNDTEAQQKWQAISPNIPTNIVPKGTPSGDFSSLDYPSSDPDCWWTSTNCVTPKVPGLSPDIVNVPEPRTLGYGFDDGPNCSHNAFYQFLSDHNQKATMFYIGSNILDWPLEAQRAVTDGHEICVHTWSHHYMTALTSPDAFAEIFYTMRIIKIVTGVTPTCFRPPFGDVDDRIRAIAAQLGLSTIIWSYDSNDWRAGSGSTTDADVDRDYQKLITAAQNGTFNTSGTIILTHELNNFTMSEAMRQYPAITAAFDHVVPVGVAFNKTQPYVETQYVQPTFEQYISGMTGISNGSNPNTSAAPIQNAPALNSSNPNIQQATPQQPSKATTAFSLPVIVPAGIFLLIGQLSVL